MSEQQESSMMISESFDADMLNPNNDAGDALFDDSAADSA